MLGLVNGRYDETEGPLLIGLLIPPAGAPTLRCISVAGLTKSRVLLLLLVVGAGEALDSMGLAIGILLEWSTPAVLRMEGLSACGSN